MRSFFFHLLTFCKKILNPATNFTMSSPQLLSWPFINEDNHFSQCILTVRIVRVEVTIAEYISGPRVCVCPSFCMSEFILFVVQDCVLREYPAAENV